MQKYLWKVVSVSANAADISKNAENQLNTIQDEGYEIFVTHTLATASGGSLVIIARKPKVDANYDRKY